MPQVDDIAEVGAWTVAALNAVARASVSAAVAVFGRKAREEATTAMPSGMVTVRRVRDGRALM